MTCKCCLVLSKDDMLDGIQGITSLEQLYTYITNPELHELIITKEFAENYFTPTGLNEFIKAVHQMNEYVAIKMDDSYLKREDAFEEIIRKTRNFEELLTALLNNRTIAYDVIQTLYEKANASHNNELYYSNKFNTYAASLMQEKHKNKNLMIDYKHLERAFHDLQTKFDILTARIKHTYNIPMKDDAWLTLKAHDNRFRHILYFKEVTRVKYVDTLIYYLKELLSSYYHEPVRSIVIEGRDCVGRHYLYPGHKVNTELTMRDVIYSDIYMNGFQSKLMNDIMKNPNSTNFAIVLDRAYSNHIHLKGQNVTVVYIASELSDLQFHAEYSKIISYKSDTLHIPYIDGFEDKGSEERIKRYSSLPIMEMLLSYLEVGERVE